MADGSKKPIDQVQVGDVVEAEDPQTGELKAETVEQVMVGQGLKHLVEVTIPGDTIEATYNHPFWVVEEQKFEWAEDLKPGEHLLLASGQAAPVLALAPQDQETTVYNLSVQEIHTFFVGLVAALVHNACVGARYHGNDLRSTRHTVLYRLVHRQTGTVMKYGITSRSNPYHRYPKRIYADYRMVIVRAGSRLSMRRWERYNTRYRGPWVRRR